MRTVRETPTTPSVDLPIRWRDMVLPEEVADLFQHAKSLRFPGNRDEVLSLAMGSRCGGTFEVVYEVPGHGEVVEATVTKCGNGLAVNYAEPSMRRRDPDYRAQFGAKVPRRLRTQLEAQKAWRGGSPTRAATCVSVD